MFAINPFAELSASVPVSVMQTYIVVMVILVVGGTLLDVIHKKSAAFFFEKSKDAEAARKRELGGGEKMGIAIQTVAEDVLTSAEFCNTRRRISHLFTMYGFIIFLVSTIGLVFGYTGKTAPAIVAQLWHLGAAMVCFGGYWFWFCIRVDVSAEGNPWHRIVRADMFILSLLATNTFALIWSLTGAGVNVFLGLFILSSTVLFGGVMWSKFSHMFFKPAAAYQKRVMKADGSNQNLPDEADRTSAADRDRHSMELLKDAPLNMGLGIKREAPRHY
ncbi:MAG: adenylyl-sulfate reductase [Rhodospirillaceae bacterium]|jgi:hypothetical protein|nr:adenylyl-sulfate reductase [Rhodospirillaceae bacterium]MBT3908795.1 adenylyl-sulfate reductase [Rhodospirillaceae bacterium]MBT5298062.1 adenylyl-sulfate reductase [Rhodospirillaceae bacterium]MBT5513609.1 adenylyl-sulfate reductase [Rhodospirillaceae bacterium]MBT6608981.1 adenylyl-sulfate reductase [Rhodospirillaceae bacterium]